MEKRNETISLRISPLSLSLSLLSFRLEKRCERVIQDEENEIKPHETRRRWKKAIRESDISLLWLYIPLSLSLSLSLCLVESRFHVGSLLNESKEEKEVAQDGEYPSGT